MKKRIYSTEFKQNAITMSYQRSNIKELATELGVDVQRIYKWRKGAINAKKSSSKITKEATINLSEYKQLEKELKDKNIELEILKKAIHIFSKKDGNIINL
jgi:transposase